MDHVFDPVRSGAGGVAPGHLEKLHWAEHLGCGPDEPMEQPEFDLCEFDLAAFDRDPMACRIDDEQFVYIHVDWPGRTGPAQKRTHSRNQLQVAEWLGQVIVGSCLQSPDLLGLEGVGR